MNARAGAAHGVSLRLDGRAVKVPAGTTVAAALWNAGIHAFRSSVSGEPRGPLCGMGVCFECRVTIDGVPHRRACLVSCAAGMEVETDAGAGGGARRRPDGATPHGGPAEAENERGPTGDGGEPIGGRRGPAAPGERRGGA